MSCVWCRSQTRLRSRVAVAVVQAAPIRPLAWELPYAMGVALKTPTPPPKKTSIRYLKEFRIILSQTNHRPRSNLTLQRVKEQAYKRNS